MYHVDISYLNDIGSGQIDRKVLLANVLRERIMSMVLAPSTLLDEQSLCDEFSLSRSPVREVLRQLAGEGYLELQANRSARVSPMNYESLHGFFQAAPLIYIATTQLAAQEASASEIEKLKQVQQQFRLSVQQGDVAGMVLHNGGFHREIGKMAHNAYLMPSLNRLLIDHARLGRTFFDTSSRPEQQQEIRLAVQQHDEIIAAIECRDACLAEKVIRDHWQLSKHRMAEYIIPDAVEVELEQNETLSVL